MFNRYIWKYFLVGLELNYDLFYVMKLLKIFLIFIVIYEIELIKVINLINKNKVKSEFISYYIV